MPESSVHLSVVLSGVIENNSFPGFLTTASFLGMAMSTSTRLLVLMIFTQIVQPSLHGLLLLVGEITEMDQIEIFFTTGQGEL